MKLFLLFPLWLMLWGFNFTTLSENPKPATSSIIAAPTHKTVTPKVTTIAPKPSPKPAATTTNFVAEVESQIHVLVNEERVKAGLSALSSNETLATVARGHSADMAANNYFEHTDLSGCTSACRITNAGLRWRAVGENIFEMSGYHLSAQASAKLIVDGWMNSPGHRANILNTLFSTEGIGVVQVGSKLYATEDFALPR